MKRRTYVLWKKIVTRTVLIGILVGIFFIVFRTRIFTIETYELVGVPETYKQQILAKLQELETIPVYRVLPGNRIFSYHTDTLREYILQVLPNTSQVRSVPVSTHTIRITVTPYVPLFALDDTHIMTQDGFIYYEKQGVSTLPLFSAASSTTSTTTEGHIPKTRLSVLTSTSTEVLLTTLKELIPKIHDVLFPVAYITVDSYGDIFLFDATKKSSVRMSSQGDSFKVWSTIISAIDTEPLKSLLKTKKDELVYIDARYGNKVFYRFTNTALPTIINASTTYVDTTTTTKPIR